MKTVLITGFEPSGGESVNPSWEVASSLNNTIIDGCRVIVRQLPYTFGESLAVFDAVADALSPPLVLAVGWVGGRTDITMECVAINVNDVHIADNQGRRPVGVPIVVDGPVVWFSSSPIRAMVATTRNVGIPAPVPQTAGTLVCNHVMYNLLYKLRDIPATRGGFIHIPYLPRQAVQHPGAPNMAIEMARRTLEITTVTALQVESDITTTGGVIHQQRKVPCLRARGSVTRRITWRRQSKTNP